MNNLYVWVDKKTNTIATFPDSLPTNWKNYNGLNLMSDDKLNELGWYKIDDSDLLEFEYSAEWLYQLKQQLFESVSYKRWEAQTEAVVFNGNTFILNDGTINSLYQKRIITQSDSSRTFQWKTTNGTIELNASDIENLTNSISDYIQECFDIEASFTNDVNKITTLEDLLQVDLNITWPSTTLT